LSRTRQIIPAARVVSRAANATPPRASRRPAGRSRAFGISSPARPPRPPFIQKGPWWRVAAGPREQDPSAGPWPDRLAGCHRWPAQLPRRWRLRRAGEDRRVTPSLP